MTIPNKSYPELTSINKNLFNNKPGIAFSFYGKG